MSLFDLQEKLYAILNVTAVKSIAKIYDYVPEKSKLPFVVIGDSTAEDDSTKTSTAYKITSKMYIWGDERSMKKVKDLIEKIDELLRVDLDEFKFKEIPRFSAVRESVEYVKGTIEVVHRITEE